MGLGHFFNRTARKPTSVLPFQTRFGLTPQDQRVLPRSEPVQIVDHAAHCPIHVLDHRFVVLRVRLKGSPLAHSADRGCPFSVFQRDVFVKRRVGIARAFLFLMPAMPETVFSETRLLCLFPLPRHSAHSRADCNCIAASYRRCKSCNPGRSSHGGILSSSACGVGVRSPYHPSEMRTMFGRLARGVCAAATPRDVNCKKDRRDSLGTSSL